MKIFSLLVLITFFVSFNCYGMDEEGKSPFNFCRHMSSSEDSGTEDMDPHLIEETSNIADELMRLPSHHQKLATQILDAYHKVAQSIDMKDIAILHEMQNLGILQNYYDFSTEEIFNSVFFAVQESLTDPLVNSYKVLQRIHNHLQEAHAAKNFQFYPLGEMDSLSMEEENIPTDKRTDKMPENKRKQDNEKLHKKTKKIRKESTSLLGNDEEKIHSDKITEQTLSRYDKNFTSDSDNISSALGDNNLGFFYNSDIAFTILSWFNPRDLISSLCASKSLIKIIKREKDPLILGFNKLEPTEFNNIYQKKFSNIIVFALRETKIGDAGAELIAKLDFPDLKALILNFNRLGPAGAEWISKANFPLLIELNLKGNKIRADGAEWISNAQFPKLTIINLKGNDIGPTGAEWISKANFPLLMEFYLALNKLGPTGAEWISKANFPLLTKLDLSDNNIGAIGAKWISKANFLRLTTLDLSSNNIGSTGAKWISKSQFSKLTTLNLSQNNIRDKGVGYIIGNYEIHRDDETYEGYYEYEESEYIPFIYFSLTKINLSHNNIGDNGAKKISNVLGKQFQKLTAIDLSGNHVGDEEKKKIETNGHIKAIF